MNKIYTTDKDKFIAYNEYKSNKKSNPYIIFLHGLMSDMKGTKAQHIESYCRSHDYNFIKFDNFGHGESSGKFIEETISSWLKGLELVMQELAQLPVILIGSSMGAWIAMLAVIKHPNKIKGLICIAPAADFTEDAIWKKLPEIKQVEMQQKGILEVSGTSCNSTKYPISYKLIEDARNYLLLDSKSIKIDCPVHLIHGSLDTDVPSTVSTRLFEKITSKNIIFKLIKDSEHNLSRESDLKIITNSIDEILTTLANDNTKKSYGR